MTPDTIALLIITLGLVTVGCACLLQRAQADDCECDYCEARRSAERRPVR